MRTAQDESHRNVPNEQKNDNEMMKLYCILVYYKDLTLIA